MKKLLILTFCLYHIPAQAVVIDTVVCLDHDKREATVHHNVRVSQTIIDLGLPFEVENDYICRMLNKIKAKRNKRGN